MSPSQKINIKQTSFQLSFELPLLDLPVSLRPWEPDQLEETPALKGTTQPEETEEVLDVLVHMLLGATADGYPECLRLMGTQECDISPYSSFKNKRNPKHTIVGSVVFCNEETSFEEAYGKGAGASEASEALKNVLEKFMSMCETPGALRWATNRVRFEARSKWINENYYVAPERQAELARARQRFTVLDPPEFIGILVLPEHLYRNPVAKETSS